jgi:catechol 2,3-dioxygenase-like lactoylglutathione lyase family enzyme
MIHHIDFAVKDLERSRDFYKHALAPLGLTIAIAFTNDAGRQLVGFGSTPDPVFWIRDGQPMSGRLHVAFQASSRAAVDAFHAAAVLAGGRDNGAPGLRPRYAEYWYAAFVLDPDGHNIEAVCRLQEPAAPCTRSDDAECRAPFDRANY